MKLQELFEGKFKDLAYNLEYDKKYKPAPSAPIIKPKLPAQYYISINGKKWKEFDSEKYAMQIANTLYNKNPKLRIDVLPIK